MRGAVEGMRRREENDRNHKRRVGIYRTIWMAILFVSLLYGLFKYFQREFKDTPDFQLNWATELLGVVASTGVTLFFLDKLNERRDQNNLKQRLKGEAGSRSHDIAISAVEWMEREGWLRGKDGLLKGADLREARLSDARMVEANLQGTNLEKAWLCKARLNGANLRDARMMHTKMHNVNLIGAELPNADCHNAELPDARLGGACLEDADLSFACLEGASLRNICCKGADFRNANLRRAFLGGADFYGADLSSAKSLCEAEHHKEANWEKAKLRYIDLKGVNFREANMKGADLECANLECVDFSGTDLGGANLKGARLKGAIFRRLDGFRHAHSGNTPRRLEDMPDDQIARKTNLLGATLPDGKVFTEEMDFSYLYRFTSTNHDAFEPMLAALDGYCNRQ